MDPQNYILCIICVWSLFSLVQIYISLCFLPIFLLLKLGFHLFMFWFSVSLYLWFLAFSLQFLVYGFSALYFKFNVIPNDLIKLG